MQLEVGGIYEGKVTGITKFGAFVSFEGTAFPLKALHISTLDTQITKSWDLGKSST